MPEAREGASAKPPQLRGLRRLRRAAGHSLAGLRQAWEGEEAFRIEVVLFVLTTPLALWFGEDGVERAVLIGSVVFLMTVELLNSAVEAAVDRIGLEHHPLSGRAKDIASAAVFLAIVLVPMTWLLVLWD